MEFDPTRITIRKHGKIVKKDSQKSPYDCHYTVEFAGEITEFSAVYLREAETFVLMKITYMRLHPLRNWRTIMTGTKPFDLEEEPEIAQGLLYKAALEHAEIIRMEYKDWDVEIDDQTKKGLERKV